MRYDYFGYVFVMIICRPAIGGVLAVHSRLSLGRAGTFAALWLMRDFDFSAAHAMAWIRLQRPGSISPAQRAFLTRYANGSFELQNQK
jgi:protein-tyrosine phosphatase